MDLELKQKWVTALRSGKYEQSKKGLRSDKGFCCLGVLCDLLCGQYGSWEQRKNIGIGTLRYAMDGEVAMPSERIQQDLDILFVADELAAMNDDEGKSFAEIADYIEQKL